MADQVKKRSATEMRDYIESLQKRHQAVLEKRASLSGQLQAKKQELTAIIDEIKAAGYDPTKLAAEHERVEQELEVMAADLDKKLTEVEAAIAAFEAK
jgi:hypothetical protein